MLDPKPVPMRPVIGTNVDFQIEIVRIRLPFFLEAETSERRRFLGST
jgi:hypothetical protein